MLFVSCCFFFLPQPKWSAQKTETPPTQATPSCNRQRCRWPAQFSPGPCHQPGAGGLVWTPQNCKDTVEMNKQSGLNCKLVCDLFFHKWEEKWNDPFCPAIFVFLLIVKGVDLFYTFRWKVFEHFGVLSWKIFTFNHKQFHNMRCKSANL